MSRLAWTCCIILGVTPILLSAPPPSNAPKTDVEVRSVPFTGLEEAIRAQKGHVVVVDFWADYCVPCKKSFPKLVALHDRYAKEGLAVIAVNLDDPTDEPARKKAIQFLKDQKATFTNLLVDPKEKPEDWFVKLGIDSIPSLFVFNREGKLEKRYIEDSIKYDEVETLVRQQLARK